MLVEVLWQRIKTEESLLDRVVRVSSSWNALGGPKKKWVRHD